MAYKNKADQAAAANRHYLKNKDVLKKRAILFKIESRKRNKSFIKDYLKSHPCIDCGESDIIVLEFDHIKLHKLSNIADAVNSGWSLKKLKEEIEKCEVRCANCHRRVTYNRRLWDGCNGNTTVS